MLSDGTVRFFQFIGKDASELYGGVIAIFKKHYTQGDYDEDEIVNGEIECFMHTTVYTGVKLGFWQCVFTRPVKFKEDESFSGQVWM